MNNDFLKILWYYPMYSTVKRKKLNRYFEVLKEDALRGDGFAAYASYIINLVCFRKDFNLTINQMDDIISGYSYPHEYSKRFTCELREVLGLN